MSLIDIAISMTRAWSSVYTRGLPADLRAERREEIDCDLWHHRRLTELERLAPALAAAEIMIRLIIGIPSDIAWRMQTGANFERSTSVNDHWSMRVGHILVALPLLFLAVSGIVMLAGEGDFSSRTQQVLYGSATTVAAGTAITGLWLCATSPRVGIALTVLGCGVLAGLFFWMPFITIPAALVIIAFAAARAGYIRLGPSRVRPA